jgi:multiple sugar transport system permease protein
VRTDLAPRPVAVARRHRIRWRRHLEGYLIISPWLIGFVLFTLGPMLASLGLTFTTYELLSPPRWIGIDNYRRLLDDELFLATLYNTAYFTVLAVPAQLLLALGLALLLNLRLRGIGLFRTLYYLPTVMPAIAGVLLWVMLLNPDLGLVNNLLRLVGVEGPRWLTGTGSAKPALVLISLWYVGGQMLVFLAALQGIPQELYEAASIDGANVFGRFLHVTLPMLSPAIFFNLVIGVIHASQTFTLAFIATGGGPVNSTLFLALYVYEQAFQGLRMGYAATLAWVMLLVILVLTVVQFGFSRWVYYEGAPAAEGAGPRRRNA